MNATKGREKGWGARVMQIRKSLHGTKRVQDVSTAAMCRLWIADPTQRHQWRRLELAEEPDEGHVLQLSEALLGLVNALVLEDPERTHEQLMRYAQGKLKTLPWREPPEWKEGKCPVVPVGRQAGSRVTGHGRVIPPGKSKPPVREVSPPVGSISAVVPDVRSVPVAPAETQSLETTRTILEQIKAGALSIDAAIPLLRLTVPCIHVRSAGPTATPPQSSGF